MPLHAAARQLLEPWFQLRGLDDETGTVDVLTDLYIDAWQHGYRISIEDLRMWATGQGWSAADADYLADLARVVYRTLLHAGRITR